MVTFIHKLEHSAKVWRRVCPRKIYAEHQFEGSREFWNALFLAHSRMFFLNKGGLENSSEAKYNS